MVSIALRTALIIAVLAGLVLIHASMSLEAQSNDPALRNPMFAGFAQKYGKDWDKQVHPKVRILLDLQRIMGSHALIVGFSDEEPNPQYTNPKVRIFITQWDGADLFALGIPRVYNGKPVEIMPMRGFGELNVETVP